MVFVFVRQQNRVDMPDPGPEHLVTEIGPSVDHQPYVVPLEHGRSPQTVIAGIFRGADGTPAADHRHSLRSSRAKNRKFHTHRKKRRSFCFSRRREQKYKKNTAEKRNRRFFSHAPDNGKQRVLPYARIGWSDCRYHSKGGENDPRYPGELRRCTPEQFGICRKNSKTIPPQSYTSPPTDPIISRNRPPSRPSRKRYRKTTGTRPAKQFPPPQTEGGPATANDRRRSRRTYDIHHIPLGGVQKIRCTFCDSIYTI